MRWEHVTNQLWNLVRASRNQDNLPKREGKHPIRIADHPLQTIFESPKRQKNECISSMLKQISVCIECFYQFQNFSLMKLNLHQMNVADK